MQFSNGWLHGFKRRNNFKSYGSHSEEGDADREAAEAQLPMLRQLAAAYRVNDIFNADEFGLFYNRPTQTTIGPAPLLGRKQVKNRITVLACTNGDGTDRLSPLVLGRSRRPHCFNGRKGGELGFDPSVDELCHFQGMFAPF